VIEVRDGTALTECFGQTREVSLLLLEDQDVAVGDYLLIQAGGFAFERVEMQRAEEALALMQQLMTQGDDARSWESQHDHHHHHPHRKAPFESTRTTPVNWSSRPTSGWLSNAWPMCPSSIRRCRSRRSTSSAGKGTGWASW
jgi:hydrogenase expression/formation protein HypC